MVLRIIFSSRKGFFIFGSVACLMVLLMDNAFAMTTQNGMMDNIVGLYKVKSKAWESQLLTYAKDLFWILAGIEFSWMGIQLVLKGADLVEWLAQVVNQIFFIGFFYALLAHSSEWASTIINSFMEAANGANASAGGSGGITPSNIFDLGLSLALKVLHSVTILEPTYSIGLMIGSIIVIICFALITSSMVHALIEAYFIISAGVLLMGFGGSRWTKEYAVKTFTYAVSVGAKLFVLQLLVGLGESMIHDWANGFEIKQADILSIIGASIVLAALTHSIPNIVQGLINGYTVGTEGGLFKTLSSTAGAAMGAVGAAVGGGMAVKAAMQLAKEQQSGPGYTGSDSIGATLSQTMKNLGGAVKSDMGRRLSGRAHHGTMGGRMAEILHQRRAELSMLNDKPESTKTEPHKRNIIR